MHDQNGTVMGSYIPAGATIEGAVTGGADED